MSAPPAKKQKTMGINNKPPIVFNTPGYPLDVRLEVFDQDFHLSLAPLKLYSAFFRKFLDSPDKAADSGGACTKLTYHWTTEVDGEENDTWHLCDIRKAVQSDVTKYSGDIELQISAFAIILSAIHAKPYSILNFERLRLVTELADYYLALSIVSRTLDAALYRSQDFVAELKDFPCEVITAASKLRNELLFRECLPFLTGPWHQPAYLQMPKTKLRKVIHHVWLEVAAKVGETFRALTDDIEDEKRKGDNETACIFAAGASMQNLASSSVYVSLPRMLKEIDEKTLWKSGEFAKRMNGLLRNNLVLTSQFYAEDYLQDHFLSAAIDNEDLPWDVNEENF
ncbi:hypothetical protein VTL71DRAFT_5450 [Oculimacula yallundae]|uniref:BTB domain-containing protein n=1 Tax=Oculimacula yallundae TaxID=86028 RepID=A0ABR4C149_9HELO